MTGSTGIAARFPAKREMNEAPRLSALQALFMSHLQLEIEHPRIARMRYAELRHPEPTPVKTVAQSTLRHFSKRLARELDAAKEAGAVAPDTNSEAAATLFVSMMQGLVAQSLLLGNPNELHARAPELLEILLRSVEQAQIVDDMATIGCEVPRLAAPDDGRDFECDAP